MATYSTTVVSANAFKNNTLLKTVVADSILSVGDSAFEGCSNMYSAKMSSCVDVGDSAFSGCAALRTFDAPRVSSVGNFAFYNSGNLSSYSFPECLSVGSGAFKMSVTYTSELAGKDPARIDFRNCRRIGDQAFYVYVNNGSNYTKRPFSDTLSLYFPECEKVGDGAFAWTMRDSTTILYPNLSVIHFPKCREIGANTFAQGMDSVNISRNSFFLNLREISFPECEKVGDKAFAYWVQEDRRRGENLLEVNFPKCKSVGASAFMFKDSNRYTSNVSSMDFHSCELIGANAFERFASSKGVGFNLSSCLSAMDGAFIYSSFMSSVNLDSCIFVGTDAFRQGSHTFSKIDLPSVKRLGSTAFYQLTASNLSAITFGPELSSVGYMNFYGLSCGNAVTLSVDPSSRYFEVDQQTNIMYSKAETDQMGKGLIDAYLLRQNIYDDDISYVRAQAAYGCANVLSVKSLSCKVVESEAFRECSNLKKVELPSVTGIGDSAFYDASLTGVLELPECSSIGNYAFSQSNETRRMSMATVYMPKCVSVGRNAFSENRNADDLDEYSYTYVYMPSCLSIGFRAFASSGSPSKCTLQLGENIPVLVKEDGSEETRSSRLYQYIKEGMKLCVPAVSVDAYRTKWGDTTPTRYTTWDPAEESRPSFQGYFYQGDEPKAGDATILKMTTYASLTEENANVPGRITED